jgi:hypothetical protein
LRKTFLQPKRSRASRISSASFSRTSKTRLCCASSASTHQACANTCTAVSAKTGHETFAQAASTRRFKPAHTQADHPRSSSAASSGGDPDTDQHRQHLVQKACFGQTCLRVNT